MTAVRLGFLGVGWIGRHRLEALARDGVEVAAIADPCVDARAASAVIVPDAARFTAPEDLLSCELDGVVIASPSALHAEQSRAALERGLAVFCQKPLGRTRGEVATVLSTARRADRLLGVDLSYRYAAAFQRAREVIRAGEVGEVFAAELAFHNAYGPDKAWFRDPALAGGGCLIDLGTHLVDLAFWMLGEDRAERIESRLFSDGRRIEAPSTCVEDYAVGRIDFSSGATASIACSWNLPAGQDAVISAVFYGTRGGVAVRNVNGSFYDFIAERLHGTARHTLSEPPDAWGGRAAVSWARRLGRSRGYDAEADELLEVATTIDRMYGR